MQATRSTCPKGPALLAKAGVTLAEALWFYRQRARCVTSEPARLAPIRRKVNRFVARNGAPMHLHPALV